MDHGGGGAFGRAQHIEGFFKQLGVFTEIIVVTATGFVVTFTRSAVNLLLNRGSVLRRAVDFERFDEPDDFFIGYKGTLCTNEA